MNKRKRVSFYFKKSYRLSTLRMLSFTEIFFAIYTIISIPLILIVGSIIKTKLGTILLFINIMLFISILLSTFDRYKIAKHKYNKHHKIIFISAFIIQISFYLSLYLVSADLDYLSSICIFIGFFFYLINTTYVIGGIGNYFFYLFLKINYPLELKKFPDKVKFNRTRISRYMTLQNQIAHYLIRKFNVFLGGTVFLYIYFFVIAKLGKLINENGTYNFLNRILSGILLDFGIFLAILSVALSISTFPLMLKIENKAYEEYEKSKKESNSSISKFI